MQIFVDIHNNSAAGLSSDFKGPQNLVIHGKSIVFYFRLKIHTKDQEKLISCHVSQEWKHNGRELCYMNRNT